MLKGKGEMKEEICITLQIRTEGYQIIADLELFSFSKLGLLQSHGKESDHYES